MSDQMSNSMGRSEASAERKGFFSTPLGKVVLIGGSVGVLVTIVAVVALVLLVFLDSGGSNDLAGPTGGAKVIPSSNVSTGTPPSGEASTPPEPVTNADVYAFRDPFQPLMTSSDSSSTGTNGQQNGETPGGTNQNAGANTLLLQDIISEDGVYHAVVTWEDQQFTLAEGESIQDTPWQVLSISTSSVTMLYGDDRVVLTEGQGVTK